MRVVIMVSHMEAEAWVPCQPGVGLVVDGRMGSLGKTKEGGQDVGVASVASVIASLVSESQRCDSREAQRYAVRES